MRKDALLFYSSYSQVEVSEGFQGMFRSWWMNKQRVFFM